MRAIPNYPNSVCRSTGPGHRSIHSNGTVMSTNNVVREVGNVSITPFLAKIQNTASVWRCMGNSLCFGLISLLCPCLLCHETANCGLTQFGHAYGIIFALNL